MSTILRIKMTKKILLLSIVITGTFSWQILKLLKLGGGGELSTNCDTGHLNKCIWHEIKCGIK